MSKLRIETILCRAGKMDNYSYLIIDEATGKSAIIDPSESAPIIARCQELKVKPDYILNTHHHYDHTDGNLELKKLFGAKVVGASYDAHRIPGIDISLSDGDTFSIGNSQAKIILVKGHTTGHILWYFQEAKALFTGDVLFNLCIGGLFEGNVEEMFTSLNRIKSLPDDVDFYPGHEYTIHGVGLAQYLEPQNLDLQKYLHDAEAKLEKGLPVCPVKLGIEKKVNPYLKAQNIEALTRIFNM